MKNLIIDFLILSFLYACSLNKDIKNINYEEDKSIGIITINYPKNSIDINNDILEEMNLILSKIDIDNIKVLIITDNSLSNNDNNLEIDCEKNINKNIFNTLDNINIPIISAINNYALGIMFEISLISDFRICSDKAIIGYPLLNNNQRLSEIIGKGMAKQIMYTKQYIKPEEALRIKLVNNIYKQKDLLKKAREIGETICKNSRNAIKHAKLAIDKGTQYLNNNNGNNNIYKLKCSFQNYDWGQYANNSLVAVALKKNGREVYENKRYAEYWMGTHPNGPSYIIKNDKEILLSDEINGQLSFLFKILSINKPLSIQLHPDKLFAEELHKKYPKIYKDDNHKPELFIALSDFELLFGFVGLNKAVEIVKNYKECFNFKEGQNLIEKPNLENYKLFFEKLIYLEKDESEAMLKLLFKNEEIKKNKLIQKLYNNYGYDSGIIISLFMNYLHKKKGESLFIDKNIPHSYIHGNCLELMSCSDNVIRLGLTPKLVDKENFDKIVKKNFEDMIYEPNNTNQLDFIKIDKKNKIINYDIEKIKDFKITSYDITENKNIYIENNSIIFCLEGSIKINGIICEEFNSYFIKNEIKNAKIELNNGSSYAKLYKVYKKQ